MSGEVCATLGVAEADIEDVCQEVFITVHRKLSEFEGRSALRTWLYGISLRVASDYRRRAYVRRERAVAEPRDDSAGTASSQPDVRAEARGTLLTCSTSSTTTSAPSWCSTRSRASA